MLSAMEPPEWTASTARDDEHLKLLSVFYYVFAALSLLGILFGLFYAGMGVFMLCADPSQFQDPGMQRPADPEGLRFVGVVFLAVGLGILLACVTWSVLNILAANALRAKRRLMLCQITAGLNCLSVPFGTALGVFTFIVLSRPSVAAAFKAGSPALPR